MAINLSNILPLIVPSDYYVKGTWELPHYKFPDQSFILTWVIFSAGATMKYIDQEEYQELNNTGNNWQQNAFENLRQSIAGNENFFTQFKMSDDRERLLWICFMNKDGIGSSRLLLSQELKKGFPNGYYLALPDRSCGLAISKDIDKEELQAIEDLVKTRYTGATTGMSGRLHFASDFGLPETWIQPIDKNFSAILANGILKLQVPDS